MAEAKSNSEFYGIELASQSPQAEFPDYMKLLEALRPKPSPAPLIPIGPGGDGTYLVPDDLDGIVACFSPGVNNFKNFEDQLFHRYRIASHMCDASSDVDRLRTPLIAGHQTFEKLWLDVSGADDAISLDDWVARHRPDSAQDLLLQIDIEGAEYRNILAASEMTMQRFRIIIMEIHGLYRLTKPAVLLQVLLPFFDKLGRHFTCVHHHPNNASRVVTAVPGVGIEVPSVTELTFLRNDRFDGRSLHSVELPHPSDIRYNIPSRPPLHLGDFYRGRPASAREMLQMDRDLSDWRHRDLKQQMTLQHDVLREKIAELEASVATLRSERL